MDSIKHILSKEVIRKNSDRQISDVIKSLKNGEIIIPDYQRNFVWDNKAQSRFIESILLNIPVPPIFIKEKVVLETQNMSYEVIDGSQRLRTLLRFDSNNLKLTGLEKLKEFNGSKINTLPKGIMQQFFSSREIQFIKIDKSTDNDIQYDIFERLNQGAISLNAQELRNCIYHGDFNDFLLKLRENELYKSLLEKFNNFKYIAIPKDISEDNFEKVLKPDKNRFNDVEMILRFFSLYESKKNNVENKYKPPRKEMLNDFMHIRTNEKEINQSISDNELDNIFLKAIQIVKTVFRDKQFKRFFIRDGKAIWLPSMNKSLFDIQMLGLLDYDLDVIEENKDLIYYGFIELLIFNADFNRTIYYNTDQQINNRFIFWEKHLEDLFKNKDDFNKKFELIKEIHLTNNICKECNKPIMTIEESDIEKSDIEQENHNLIHKQCLLMKISPKQIESDLKNYERRIVKQLHKYDTLPSHIYRFIENNGPVTYPELEEFIIRNNYKTGNQILQIIGVLNKVYDLQIIGTGINKKMWFQDVDSE
jgi:hypothetical protein